LAQQDVYNSSSDSEPEQEVPEQRIARVRQPKSTSRAIGRPKRTATVVRTPAVNESDNDENEQLDPMLTYGGDEGDETGALPTIIWKPYHIAEFQPLRNGKKVSSLPIFKATSGPDNIPKNVHSELDYFKLLFDDDIMSQFVNSTNSYATDCKVKNWINIDEKMVLKFFAIILYMGISNLPSREMYWSKKGKFNSSYVSEIMSKRQFEKILSNFHWENTCNITDAERVIKNKADPFWSISTFLKKLATNYRFYYQCGQKIDIDEMCIPFKGRHRAVVYNPNKPEKWHLKAFGLNCVETGYLSNFSMYGGKDENRPDDVAATEYPVRVLTSDAKYHHKNHILSTDNWYTSIPLAVYVKKLGMEFNGTIKKTRKGLPVNSPGKQDKIFTSKSGVRGAMIGQLASVCGIVICLMSWMDNKPVNILSTYRSEYEMIVRNGKDKSRNYEQVTITRPTIVGDYNSGMGGTDSFDQRNCYYRTPVKTIKWQPRTLTHFLQATCTNAMILRRENERLDKTDYTLLIFYENLIDQMAGKDSDGQNGIDDEEIDEEPFESKIMHRRERWLSSDILIHQRLRTRCHMPKSCDNSQRFECRVCRSKQPVICVDCNASLCIKEGKECFRIFHTQKNF
jgi:hypothetical protein